MIEEKTNEVRGFFIDELMIIHQMCKFHDVLWKFLVGNYKGYSTDHNAEGPMFNNKNMNEQHVQWALEHAWRKIGNDSSKWCCFPQLLLNPGFDYERVNDQNNIQRVDYNSSLVSTMLSADKRHHNLIMSEGYFRDKINQYGFLRQTIPEEFIETPQINNERPNILENTIQEQRKSLNP